MTCELLAYGPIRCLDALKLPTVSKRASDISPVVGNKAPSVSSKLPNTPVSKNAQVYNLNKHLSKLSEVLGAIGSLTPRFKSLHPYSYFLN